MCAVWPLVSRVEKLPVVDSFPFTQKASVYTPWRNSSELCANANGCASLAMRPDRLFLTGWLSVSLLVGTAPEALSEIPGYKPNQALS
jgi:hypothetical protein